MTLCKQRSRHPLIELYGKHHFCAYAFLLVDYIYYPKSREIGRHVTVSVGFDWPHGKGHGRVHAMWVGFWRSGIDASCPWAWGFHGGVAFALR